MASQKPGERLRWVREEFGWSQARISEEAGVTQSAWSLYERGLRLPDHYELPRLGFDVSEARDARVCQPMAVPREVLGAVSFAEAIASRPLSNDTYRGAVASCVEIAWMTSPA